MGNNQPNLEGEVQNPNTNPPSGGGGIPSTANLLNVTSTGGLTGFNGVVMIFAQSPLNGNITYKLDATNFNCEEDCEYDFRVEELQVYTQPTTSKILFRYRDLGSTFANFFFQGNVLGKAVISKIVTAVFGGANDGKIKTGYADLVFTAEAPQLIMQRPANSGSSSICKILVEFEQGDRNLP